MNKCNNFIIKISSRCNLNCSYCYMFNLGDNTYLQKPKIMSESVALFSLKRIYKYALKENITEIKIVLHGGEPLLCGYEWIEWFINSAEALRPKEVNVRFSLQTNGTLINKQWIDFFLKHNISIGVSFDGLRETHDTFRVDHSGRGSYDKVVNTIKTLSSPEYSKLKWGILVVANPEYSGEKVYRNLLDLGVKNMDFLWPEYNNDNLPSFNNSLSGYFNEIFDAWFNDRDPCINVRWFKNVIRMILSGTTEYDNLGPAPLDEVVIETDGSIEPLDLLRTCMNGMTRLGLNVKDDDIENLFRTPLYQVGLNNQNILPQECKDCSIYQVCGGGYMPHRWKKETGFSNKSVHCRDLYNTINHIVRVVVAELKKADIEFEVG
ncbi:radical SAM protein [Paenibacillus sp.]|nr:radical SAM protein [Paenibacillus sp.]